MREISILLRTDAIKSSEKNFRMVYHHQGSILYTYEEFLLFL